MYIFRCSATRPWYRAMAVTPRIPSTSSRSAPDAAGWGEPVEDEEPAGEEDDEVGRLVLETLDQKGKVVAVQAVEIGRLPQPANAAGLTTIGRGVPPGGAQADEFFLLAQPPAPPQPCSVAPLADTGKTQMRATLRDLLRLPAADGAPVKIGPELTDLGPPPAKQ